jgi:UDP-glucose 4-epimerase
MNVYGARQDYKGAYVAAMMKMLDRIDQGLQPVVFGDGSQQYDFIAVQDVARANLCAMRASASGKCYNVGRGIGTSLKEIAERILALTDSNLGIHYEPAGQTFVTKRIGCAKAAERDLDFRWSIDLDQGLRELIDWRASDKEAVELRRRKA